MIVTLIGKDVLYKTKLPKVAIGNYWITDENDKKIINIEGNGVEWIINNSNCAQIINPKKLTSLNATKIAQQDSNLLDKIILKEYSMNYIYLKDYSKNVFVLYCEPNYDDKFIHLNIKNTQQILIGKETNCHITYNNPLVRGNHARIFFSNGKLMLENLDSNFGTFVNNKPVTPKNKMLFNGDIIFIMGLKIIIIGRNIYINNPFNRVVFDDKMFEISEKNFNILESEENKNEEDGEIELYSEKDYFTRAPRITNLIEREKIKIDPPPQNENKENTPLIYALGSSLSMGVVMLISMISTMDRLSTGNASTKSVVLSIMTTMAMLVTILLFPILNKRYERRKKVKNEEKRQKRYKEYINSKIELIDNIMSKQKKILYENHISAEECAQIIVSKGSRLWERKIEDADFLVSRLGIGNIPLEVDIEYPKTEFRMEDDNLIEILNTIVNKSKTLEDVPITISLTDKNIAGVIVEDNELLIEKFMQTLLIQLVTLHSYEDLKLVFLLKKDRNNKWEHLKTLPHIWDDDKQIRFWAEDYLEMKEISRYLEEVFYNRISRENTDYKSFSPYYLIITDDYKTIDNLKIVTEILNAKRNVGFGIFCITNNLLNLPNGCKSFIKLEDDNTGTMFENENSSKNQKHFIFDSSYTFFFEKIGRQISSIPIKSRANGRNALPNTYTFLEMYDAGKIEQLNIWERWNTNDSTRTLQAPIGIDPAGMPIVLDIHEKAHGPHGLIAGSTGSGKSEFIITYILSLTVNYHPDDLTIILIDYKGGGLAGAFQKREIKLPHLVGTITNIDTIGLQRSLASIQSELRRRQIIFNEARNQTDEGTIDIYKYQKLYHEGLVSEPVPHLLIICDEFAELKQQQEEFMTELMSVARIGRSLGVHLILSTQKPAGIVNAQIRSNSKFGVCLKVQDRQDSIDVIKRPDAAELKKAGQFYLQVGNNEYFTLGLAAWSGALYIKSDVIKKNVDNSIKFVSNIGSVIKEVGNSKKMISNNQGEQLTNIVKYICDLAQRENIHPKSLWLENIPEIIYINNLIEKYKVKKTKHIIAPVIGEFDDPFNQRQGVLQLNLSSQGNTVIYGNAESGKETLLSTIVYDVMTRYTPEEAQMYVLDFGSEALKIFKQSPNVGDVIGANDSEKISRLFEFLQKEIKIRTEILSNYNGDYKLYLNKNANSMPMIIVMINNYESFSENCENKYEDQLQTLTRDGVKCGIVFIMAVSSHNEMRFRLSRNFTQKLALQLNNQDDYLNIFDRIGKKRPSPIFGRGLVKLEDIYEFQTARICEPENWNTHIRETCEKLKQKYNISAKNIPVLPDRVSLENVQYALKDLTTVPIGINKKNLEVFCYDFKKNFINIITAKNIDVSAQFVGHLLEEIKLIKDISINLLDAERIFEMGEVNFKLKIQNFILELENNPKKNKDVLCIIIGLDKFINDIENGENGFYEMLKKAKELRNYNFIIVENATKLKSREFNTWYKMYINNDRGLWIGNGVREQYVIKVNINDKNIMNRCGDSFGHVIKQEEATPVKLLGMKENGDENG